MAHVGPWSRNAGPEPGMIGAGRHARRTVTDPTLENVELAQAAAEAAAKVVKQREHHAIANKDEVSALITDACATPRQSLYGRRGHAAARNCGRAPTYNSHSYIASQAREVAK